MRARISVLGLYEWDNTLFDNLVIPEGLTTDDKALIIGNLLAELAELEVIYPDFDIMKSMIGLWSQKELPVWQRLYDTTLLEYNPIENYDRMENWTDGAESRSNSTTSSNGEQHSVGNIARATHDEQGTNVAGNNTTAGLTPRDKIIGDGTNNEQNSISMAHTDGASSNGVTVNDAVHTGRTHGNIGVTTTQQMIEQERNVAKFNIFNYIIDSFKSRFCLLVY